MRRIYRTAMTALGIGLASAAPSLASFIETQASGKGALRSLVRTGYQGVGSDASDFGDDSGRSYAHDDSARWRCDALHTETPTFFADPGPRASAQSRTVLTFGRPIGAPNLDTIQFNVWASASAYGAMNHVRNPSAARISSQNAFLFNTIEGNLPAGTTVGTLRVSPLKELEEYETLLRFDVFKDGRLVRSAEAGSSGFTLPVVNDSRYQLRLVYRIRVPYEFDPDFRVGAWATLENSGLGRPRPIPEPAFLSLAAAVLLALRRQGRPPTPAPSPKSALR